MCRLAPPASSAACRTGALPYPTLPWAYHGRRPTVLGLAFVAWKCTHLNGLAVSICLVCISYLAAVVLTILLCAVSEALSDKCDVCQEAFYCMIGVTCPSAMALSCITCNMSY